MRNEGRLKINKNVLNKMVEEIIKKVGKTGIMGAEKQA
jgi:hypothetical protein